MICENIVGKKKNHTKNQAGDNHPIVATDPLRGVLLP